MKFTCLLLGHRVEVRFFWNSRWKAATHKRRAVTAVAVCSRCEKELSPPSNPPKGTR